MNVNQFEFLIASVPDREKVACEIYYKLELIAEISQETNELMLEIYPCTQNKWWDIPLISFQRTLEKAKNHLLGKGVSDSS